MPFWVWGHLSSSFIALEVTKLFSLGGKRKIEKRISEVFRRLQKRLSVLIISEGGYFEEDKIVVDT